MIKYLDGWDIAAQIRLTRQVHKGTVLLLEGQNDALVFSGFINSSGCEIEIANGKKNVVAALDLLEDEGFPGIVALIDADFDRIVSARYSSENLFLTDFHDLDLMIFVSTAFDRLVKMYSDDKKLEKFEGGDLPFIRRVLIDAALPIAFCRLVSERHKFNLNFKEIEYQNYVSPVDLTVNTTAFIEELLSKSKTRCTVAQLERHIELESVKPHDKYQLVNGHDASAVLGVALRQLLGTRREVHTWASEIEKGLRLAFDRECLVQTNLFAELQKWEASRTYKIFC